MAPYLSEAFIKYLGGRKLLVACGAETQVERMAILRAAIRVRLRLWAPRPAKSVPTAAWRKDRKAKPLVTALLVHGMALMEEGHRGEATKCLRFLLRLDLEDRIDAIASMEEVGLVTPASVHNDDGRPALGKVGESRRASVQS
jgi:hypothetical protein